MKTPIVLTAHNRPEYLKPVIDSLRPQCKERDVFCFIDGPRFKEDVEKVVECYELCKSELPTAQTFCAKANGKVRVPLRKLFAQRPTGNRAGLRANLFAQRPSGAILGVRRPRASRGHTQENPPEVAAAADEPLYY